MNRLDVVHFIVTETLAKQMPGCSREQIEAAAKPLLQPIHEMLGGDRYYIPERSPALADERRKTILRDSLTDAPTEVIQTRHGISRATIYRLAKKG